MVQRMGGVVHMVHRRIHLLTFLGTVHFILCLVVVARGVSLSLSLSSLMQREKGGRAGGCKGEEYQYSVVYYTLTMSQRDI